MSMNKSSSPQTPSVPRTTTGGGSGPIGPSPRQRIEAIGRLMEVRNHLDRAWALLSGPGMPREAHDALKSLNDAIPAVHVGAMSLLGDASKP